jgi:hypothetical protein
LAEFGTCIWSPYLLKDIDLIERVQRRFTKRIPGLSNLSYSDRLKHLNLESLEYRRLVFDLEMVYKIIHRTSISLNSDDFFSFAPATSTRSNSLRLLLPQRMTVVTENFFTFRVIRIWNSLPDVTVMSENLPKFRQLLKQVNLWRFLRGRGLGDH